ncbi:MAG TPA: class I SAM-dependent methyltransferase [Acidimicrobiales bacterium]|nr:class I SAM-dependent methyltransferase [Acidimicrobiales bacterium]
MPPLVARAYATAEAIGFGADGGVSSCLPGVGRLLAVLAAGHPGGRLAEIGTGVGAGTAWMASAMDNASTLVSVEVDPERAELARQLLADDPRVTVVTARWQDHLPGLAPFDLVFVDGGYEEHLREDAAIRDAVVDLVRVGGQLVLDDLSPRPPGASTGVDHPADAKRELALRHPRLVGAELYVPGAAGEVGGTRSGALVMTRTS